MAEGTGVNLATSILTKVPDQAAAVKDVYDTVEAKVVNSYQDLTLTSQEIKDKFSLLSQYAGKAKDKLLKTFDIKNGLTIDKDGMIGKIGDALSDASSRAKSIMKEMNERKNSLMAFYTENKNKVTGLIRDANSIYAKVGNAYQAVSSMNLTDLRSVTRAINAIGGAANGVGLSTDSALGGIYADLVNEAAELGIPDAFNSVVDGIYASQEIYNKAQSVYRLATDVLPNAISRGDIRLAANIAERIGDGGGSVFSMRPDSIRGISKNNQGWGNTDRVGTQYRDYDAKYRAIEPNWDISMWQPDVPAGTDVVQVRDVSAVLDGSDHTRDVFIRGGLQSEDPNAKIFVIMSNVGRRDVDAEIRRQFPYSTSFGQPNQLTFDSRIR